MYSDSKFGKISKGTMIGDGEKTRHLFANTQFKTKFQP
jgi:hypothetical protein